MKKLLKYLLLIVVAAAFVGSADRFETAGSDEAVAEKTVSSTIYHISISASDSELCLPRQVSSANSVHLQGVARRTNYTHRNNVEFAAAGRVINAGIRYFTQLNSIICHSNLIEPTHKLHALGRLII